MNIKRIFFFLLTITVGCRAQHPHEKIVLVNAGMADREGIAELLNHITALNPSVVAIDFHFSIDKDIRGDNELIAALDKCKKLVLVSMIDDYSGQRINYDKFTRGCLPKFKKNATTGFVNVTLEDDQFNTLKKFSQWEYVDGMLERSFAVQAVFMYDSVKAKEFSMYNKKNCEVDYTMGLRKFNVLSIEDFLSNQVEKEAIENKIVMVGFLGPGDSDKFFSPLNDKKEPLEPDMYGLEFQAQIVAQVLEGRSK